MLVSLTAAADSGVLESYNQAMFKFNDSVDQAAVKPIAKAYKAVVPSPLRTGVNNFFNNLRDAWTAVNQFLQGKPDEGLSDAGRFAINSTFGIFGLFDVASADDIPKHTEDFGQTLGYWGVGEGSYFVIPLLGPSTVRDTAALFADWEADPVGYLDDVSARNSLYALRAVDDRRAALNATNTIDEMAIDRYQAYKNAWLAHRRYDVTDGAYIAPDDPEQEEETE
jgi:phospholipid-binding lipoprotein MlaA